MQMMQKKNKVKKGFGSCIGFTLIEILVVMAVMAILLGLITTGGTIARKKAKIYRARTMIASLETALAMYHADYGAYPDPILGNANLVNLLTSTLTEGGPYMSFKDADLNSGTTVKDPWGIDYTYKSGAVAAYTISSRGPDMLSGTSDDITND